jgi:hypothetical protein
MSPLPTFSLLAISELIFYFEFLLLTFSNYLHFQVTRLRQQSGNDRRTNCEEVESRSLQLVSKRNLFQRKVRKHPNLFRH